MELALVILHTASEVSLILCFLIPYQNKDILYNHVDVNMIYTLNLGLKDDKFSSLLCETALSA